jgi:hypothetical protein
MSSVSKTRQGMTGADKIALNKVSTLPTIAPTKPGAVEYK